jgi:hypothetical protein
MQYNHQYLVLTWPGNFCKSGRGGHRCDSKWKANWNQ